MIGVKHTWMLWAAVLSGIAAFQFWNVPGFSDNYGFPVNLYYTGIAMSFVLFCLFIFVNNKKMFITFFALSITTNNLVDELFFDPTKMQLNELVFAIGIITFGIYNYWFKASIRRSGKRLYQVNPNDNNRYNSDRIKTDSRE